MESADAQLNVCGLKLRVPQACIYGCQQLIFPDIICPHVTPEPFLSTTVWNDTHVITFLGLL